MFYFNPTSPENSQTSITHRAFENFSNQSPLPNEILQMIFDGFERSELLKIRGVCSSWNKYVLDVLASSSVRKTEKLHNFVNFLSFLKENLAGYPNESEKINKDLETLKICQEKHSKKIIPFFKALSTYNLESRISETLLNLRVIDLRNLIILSENIIAPECRKMLSVADAFQQMKDTGIDLEGMTEEQIFNYENHESFTIDKTALKVNRYDSGIDEAIDFSSLPIKKARRCPSSFFKSWADAQTIFDYLSEYPEHTHPGWFDTINGIIEPSYFIKCTKMCLKALKENKFNRLVKALKEKQEIIATLFIIRYLKVIGQKDRASQIEVLLKPGTMEFVEVKPGTEFSDFWADESAENITQLGKREKEEFDEQRAKKTKTEKPSA